MDYEGEYEILDYAFDQEDALDRRDNKIGAKQIIRDIYLESFMKNNTIINFDEWKDFIE
jgi:hypothetical protein